MPKTPKRTKPTLPFALEFVDPETRQQLQEAHARRYLRWRASLKKEQMDSWEMRAGSSKVATAGADAMMLFDGEIVVRSIWDIGKILAAKVGDSDEGVENMEGVNQC
ncbi:hypothetical protein HK097_009305 [Rhizophlyctis rosea]|uniref:Uncharacterized protein n=1 Tax=Rhizophlyctis rosea TaxID=64517 RepID=A0AAD5SBH2_9FUNG|nr:hypothetical protein HK097_009305 [Rhizophlyctis rosea]